jgi:uncharacterized protein YkwD
MHQTWKSAWAAFKGRRRPLAALVLAAWLAAPAAADVMRYVPPSPEQIETELLERVNRERERLGRRALQLHPLLQEIARAHSAKMAAEGRLSHHFPGWPTPEQKLRLGNACFLASSENVACSPTPGAEFIHEALMDSIRHRINILDERMLQAGIGVCREGNRYYVSEEFAAIIECPSPPEVMIAIENSLCRFYGEKFGVTPVIAVAARTLAKVSAQQNLAGIPIMLDFATPYRMRAVNICYNELERILAELKKEMHGAGIEALAVGVVWGWTTASPGGVFSVSLLIFEAPDRP